MGQQGRLRIGVDLDLNKSKFNEVQAALQALQHITAKDLINSKNANEDLNSIISTAKKLEDALNKSFNPKLNSINLSQFKRELGALNLKQVEQQFAKVGAQGQNAFRNVAVELMTTNKHMKESSVLLDKMATTLANTVRWQVATQALNSMTGSVQKAYYFAKDLDTSLNDIRIVTEKGADEMAQFARHANKAAKELRALTTDYTKASLIYYQQGLGDQEVQERAETTVKVANITKQSADTVSGQLTAIWNGYKASAAETEIYIDKVSAVAARTAADLEELATGMSQVASAANIMGVDIDQLNAQLATIVSVTREAPESIGTALKTVYARMSDIEAGLDTETTLGEYTKKMKELGFDALDANKKLRDQGEVIEEIGNKWKSLSREQQTALAQTIAGTRQYSRMMALFDNWGMYEDALNASKDSVGALQKQQDIYTESIEAHLKSLSAEGEELYSTLFKPEDITPAIDAITTMVDAIENLIESIGGGKGLIKVLGSVGLNVFSDKITQSIGRTVRNVSGFTDNLRQQTIEKSIMNELDITDPNDKRMRNLIELKKKQLEVSDLISEDEFKLSNEFIKQTNELYKQSDILEENKNKINNFTSQFSEISVVTDEITGAITNIDELKKALGTVTQFADPSGPAQAKKDLQESFNLIQSIKNEEKFLKGQNTRRANIKKRIDDEDSSDPNAAQLEALNEELAAVDKNIAKHTQNMQDSIQALNKEIQKLDFKEIADGAEEFSNYLDPDKKEAFLKATAALSQKIPKENEGYQKQAKYLKEVLSALEIYESIGKEINVDKTELLRLLDQYNDSLEENSEAIKNNNNAQEELQKQFDLTKTIGRTVDAIGTLSNAFTGLSTFANLGNIWNDEQLTTGEKIAQTFTNIATGATMALPAILQIGKGIKTWGSSIKELTGVKLSEAIVNNVVTDSYKDQVIEILKAEKASNKLGEEKVQEALAHIANGEAIDKETQDYIQQNSGSFWGGLKKDISNKGKNISKGVKAIRKGAVTGLGKLGTAVSFGKLSGAAAIAAGGTLVGAAAAAAVAIYAAVKAYNKQADTLKAANEEQQKMNENLTNAQQRYDEVKQSIDGYRSSLETLKELTEGTTGWKDAILETNEAALKLLNTYPELAQYLEPSKNGTIQLSEAGLIQYQNLERAKVSAAQIAATNATQRQRQAQIEYDTAMLIRKDTSNNFFNVEGVEHFIAELENSSYADILNNSNKLSKELQKVLEKSPEALQKLTATIEQNNKLLAIENAANYAEQLRAQGYSSEDAAVLGGIASANATNKDVEVEKRAAAIATRIKAINNEDLIKEWAEATGRTIEEGTLSKTGAGWGGRSGKFSIGDQTFTFEQLVKDLAAVEYDKEQTDAQSIKKYQDDLNKIQSKGVKDIVSSVAKASGAITANALEDFTGADIDKLKEQLEENLPESLDNFRDELKETAKNLEEARTNPTKAYGVNQSVVDAAVAGAGENQWQILFDKFGSKAAGNILDVGQNIFNVGGSTGLSAFQGFIEELDENAQTVFTEVDFASEEWEKQLLQTAEGIDLDKEALNRFQYYVKQFAPSAKTAEERLKNLNEVLASIKEQGQILDPEKFETLKQELPMEELNNYFTQMADGTYMLTSAASAFLIKARASQQAATLEAIRNEVGERDKWKEESTDLLNWKAAPKLSSLVFEEEKFEADKKDREELYNQVFTRYAGIKANNGVYTHGLYDDYLAHIRTTATNKGWSAAKELASSYGIAVNDKGISWGDDEERKKLAREAAEKAVAQQYGNAGTSALDYQYQSYTTQGIHDWIDALAGVNLLKPDEVEKFKAEATNNPDSLKKYRGKSNQLIDRIYDTAKKNATDGKFDDKKLQQLVTTYLQSADSAEEFEEFKQYLSDEFTVDFSSGKYKEIAEKAFDTVKINERTNDLTRYNQQLGIQETKLADVESQMSKLNDLMSIIYGQDALDNLDAQNELINKQIVLLKEEFQLQQARKEELLGEDFIGSALQGNLETILGKDNVGSFESVLKELGVESLESTADYFNFITALNNAVINSDTKDLDLKTGALDSIIEVLGSLFSGETEEKIRAAILNQLSNNLEAFELELDLALNVTEAERSYNKFLHAIAEDEQDIFRTHISDAGTLAKDMATYQKGLQDLAIYEVVDDERFKELQEKAKEEGYKLAENLISATDFQAKRQALVNDLISTTIDLQQTQLSVIELQSNAQKKQIDYLNTVNSMLESQVELTQLIYGDDTDKVGDFYGKIVDNNKAIRDSAKATYDYWNSTYADIQANPDQFSQEYKDKVIAELTSSTEQYMSAVTNVVKAQQQEYLNFLKQSLKEFKVESYGKEWDWIKFDEDQYLDSIDTLYAIEELEATFRKAANESTDVKTQQKINSLLEDELASLEKRDKLTQYDFDRAKKKLDILQAEIALEEARNSTTSMRLMRGADGTYGFQYVADMDAVSEAQENLREANQSLYELDTNRYRENLDQFYSIYQEYVTKMQEFWADGDLTAEESKELAKLAEQMQGLADISMVAQENLRMSAADSVTTLGGTTEDIIQALDEKFNTGLAGIVGKVSENGIQVVFAELEQKIKETAAQYFKDVQAEEQTLNTLLNNENNGTIGLYKDLTDEQSKVIANITTEAEKINDQLVPAMQDLNAQYADTVAYLREMNDYWNSSKDISNRPAPKFEGMKENSMAWFLDSSLTITGSQKYKNSGARSEAKEYFNRAFEWIETNAKIENIDAWLGKDGSYANLKQGLLSDKEWVDIDNFQLIDKLIRAIQNQEISAFNTGGYTGEWGTDGRLAMLHEKELVLNQTDTHNMLLAVSTLRNLASALDLQAMHTQAKALSGLESSIAAWELANEMAIEQNVYITAEFPSATRESEIREAILGLANAATQHAYKNTRV